MKTQLYVPRLEELVYRKEHLNEDPETMSYNRGYDIGIPEYDPETGCIAFPKEKWAPWYEKWCQSSARFYAYIVRDGMFVGEVNLHPHDAGQALEMGIVLEARYRGKGYAREALSLLLAHAFDRMRAKAVVNCFEIERAAAYNLHIDCGFEAVREENGCAHLILTEERYRNR